MVRQDKLEIVSMILDVCTNGANKTKIVYKANLNFKSGSSYLDMLVKNSLVDVNDTNAGTIYKTTVKGLKLWRDFEEVQSVLKR